MAVSDSKSETMASQLGEEVAIPAPISKSFCAPNATQFKITRQPPFSRDGSYKVEDLEGDLLVKFYNYSFICPNQVVYDGQGDALVSLKRRIFTFHGRWDAYRGKKTHNPESLLFSMERCTLLPCNRTFRIKLAGSGDEFTLTSDFWNNHYKIRYNGAVIAEAEKKRKFFIHTQKVVTANAGVDRAFIASILVIEREATKLGKHGVSGGGP